MGGAAAKKVVVGLKELVSLVFERSNAVQTFWNFQVTIILALLAFFGTTTITNKKLLLAGVLSFAYLLLACVNAIAVAEVTKVRGLGSDRPIVNFRCPGTGHANAPYRGADQADSAAQPCLSGPLQSVPEKGSAKFDQWKALNRGPSQEKAIRPIHGNCQASNASAGKPPTLSRWKNA
jgi:hypothetical protein